MSGQNAPGEDRDEGKGRKDHCIAYVHFLQKNNPWRHPSETHYTHYTLSLELQRLSLYPNCYVLKAAIHPNFN